MTGSLDIVRELEEVSQRAWPARHSELVDGWVHRAAGGVTGRANSVWPRRSGSLAIDQKLALAEAFYARHDLPLVLQLSAASEPAGLSDLLSQRGFAVAAAPRAVQLSHVDLVAAVGDAGPVRLSAAADEDWFEVVRAVNTSFAAHPATARALLAGVTQPSAYAVLAFDDVPAAAGRAVLDGRWVGIFNMATLPPYRQRGAARAVLAALAEWAGASGATTAYLQMEADNDAAPALYARAGFATCYDYSYWSRFGASRRS